VVFQGTEAERIGKFREIRDAIEARIQDWIGEPRKSGEIA